ncbi:PDZ domain-containing protein [Bdellovibrio sp. HCB-110]|uniref:PDZ domain-containing protein n=1 Tax=Bdellovibrio sp. HCB-110 TaxID=3391182 RepID=UPI0039B3BDB6
MNKFKLLVFCFVSSALFLSCASRPPFQEKDSNGIGYEVKDIQSPSNFQTSATLPASTNNNYLTKYAWRSVGEVCAQRGFNFFDFSSPETTSTRENKVLVNTIGYCFKESTRRGLGITFKPSKVGLEVEHLNNKQNSSLKVKDIVLEIQGKKVATTTDVKQVVYINTAKSSVDMAVIRDGKNIKIVEPISVLAGFNFDHEYLKALRKWTN